MMVYTMNIHAQDRLYADIEETKLEWKGEKVLGEHNGTVNLKSGWLEIRDKEIVSGEFLIDMTTIMDTDGNTKLGEHLKSDDFFGAEDHPVSKLVITESTSFVNGMADIKGSLTVKGVTNPILFKADMEEKEDEVWFYTSIIIDRTEYNIRYGSGSFFENLGDRAISDEFTMKVTLIMKRV
jgi:polyisoprenoid-binding protein YceI